MTNCCGFERSFASKMLFKRPLSAPFPYEALSRNLSLHSSNHLGSWAWLTVLIWRSQPRSMFLLMHCTWWGHVTVLGKGLFLVPVLKSPRKGSIFFRLGLIHSSTLVIKVFAKIPQIHFFSFRCDICLILVHEGPLFDTNTSHTLDGKLKCAA